jgi:transcriptional regulator with XRE-family HTH domain
MVVPFQDRLLIATSDFLAPQWPCYQNGVALKVRKYHNKDCGLPNFGSQVFFLSEIRTDMPTLGEKVRSLRKKAGLTLEQFAEQIGASKSSVWELENKEKARPSADRINEVAKVLGVTPEFLMNDDVADPSIDVADEAFFRKYQSLDTGVKQQLQEILSVLDKKASS